MESDTPLDYAAFQLSPKHSRCELFVSGNGNTEKLASGLVKPFSTHLKVVEEQVALRGQFIKLEVDKHKNVESWFTKGTLERFVRFVSTPEIVELVSTFDAEMSQLEAARRIYSQGSSDQLSSKLGDGRSSSAAGADATKKELLRAIDVRLTAVKQDLNTACARAAAAGFHHDSVADLQLFAERFGATRLNEACCKYISLYERRSELFNNSSLKSGFRDQSLRCSYSSDMSIDDDLPTTTTETSSSAPSQPPKSLSSSASFPLRSSCTLIARESKDETVADNEKAKKEEVSGGGGGGAEEPLAQPVAQPSSRQLSVQDRINLFENKQKEVGTATGSGGKPVVTKPELRRLSSDVSHSNSSAPPAVLRRWSGASDMSIDLSSDKKETDTKTEVQKHQPVSKDQSIASSVTPDDSVGSNQPISTLEKTQSWSSFTKSKDDSSDTKIKSFHGGNQERFSTSEQVELKPSIVETSHQGSDAESLESGSEPITLKAPSKNTRYRGGGAGSKLQEAVAASQQRGLEIGSLRSQPRRNHSAETEEVDRKDYAPTEKTGIQKTKFQKNVLRDESSYVHGYSNTPPSGKFVQEGSGSMPPEHVIEQAYRSRQLKGNQELNDELKMKANELEKLFAEHKLRVPGDQPTYTRRSKPSDDGADQATSLPSRKQVAEPEHTPVIKSPVPVTETDSQNHRDPLQRSFSEVRFSDDSRGKFYESYMKKRDERLKEQWGSSKAEKEARMKALHDSLERNSAEMKTKLSWSADRQDPVSSARRRADRLRSFNARSAMKRQQPLDFGQLEDDEDLSEFSELKPFGNGVSRNVQGKRPLPIKNSSTSTPRTPAAPVPRSATKVASSSGRRRVQTDNPLAQSVPNFSDLRKENTKPYSAAGKAATRLRNHTRSRSTNEEEKPGRSQSLWKNSPTPESSEGVILTPLKFEKEHSESVYTQFSKNMKPKSFLRKNNGTGPGAGSGIAKMKASMVSEAMNEQEYEPDLIEDGDEEEFDTMKTEDQAVVDATSHKNESLVNSESENGDTSQTFSQVDPTLAAELPAAATSMFPVQDSPGESPMSWNSRTHHPFTYTHEASDIDASMESWNLQEADAARMRKKWGSTQKHILVTNSSGVQSRKDMTKGFKRLLKFGRKSRGTDNMADWISATTSEGDDDTEDGRDVSNRSSEDLRKSRMGYSHGLPFEGSFNESDYFSDQVHTLQSSIPTPPANFRLREDHLSGSSIKAPRSFFSLSSFRSKGSESKPR